MPTLALRLSDRSWRDLSLKSKVQRGGGGADTHEGRFLRRPSVGLPSSELAFLGV